MVNHLNENNRASTEAAKRDIGENVSHQSAPFIHFVSCLNCKKNWPPQDENKYEKVLN